MKTRTIFSSLALLSLMLATLTGASQARLFEAPAAPAEALGDAFTYQGYLENNNQPADASYDFRFSLWDAASSGSQVGSTIPVDDLLVEHGYFSASLNFGAGAFNGQRRWLQIEVRPGSSTGAYTALSPLQELTPAAHALFAKAAPWIGLTGVPAGFADNTDNDTQYSAGPGLQLAGTVFSADANYLQRRVNGSCPTGQSIRLIDQTGGVTCETDDDTTYSAGASSGLTLAGTVFSTDSSILQRRVTTSCSVGSMISQVNQDGTANCSTFNAGTGLSKTGGNTFNVDTNLIQARVTGTCSAGSSINAINSSGGVSCETDDNTTYTNGFGLQLTSNQFSVITNTIQARVSGSCRPGSMIRTINANGTVVCADDAPLNRAVPPAGNAWSNPLAPGPLVGNVNQVTTGADGLPLILYSDTSDNNYKIIHCSDPTCITATATNIDTFAPGGDYASMALDPEGRLQISYYKGSNTDLWFARCADIACTSVATRALVTSAPGDMGRFNDIVIARDGYALVVYYNAFNASLDIVHCSDRDCSGPTTVSVVDGGPMITPNPPDPSITLGADGLGLIAYLYFNPAIPVGPDLKVAHCTDVACSMSILTQLVTAWPDGAQPSITTGADALGLIVYWDMDYQRLVTVHCGDALCSKMVGPQPIHSLNPINLNPQPMVTIGAAGLGVITFYDIISGNNTQVVAHCNDLLCSTVTESTWILSASPPAITISPTGNPFLTSPGVGTGGPLQTILCNDPFCVQYFRRR